MHNVYRCNCCEAVFNSESVADSCCGKGYHKVVWDDEYDNIQAKRGDLAN